ncbi:MAG: PH domain-containing protein [Jatrophihabitantaceae bacterium]
MAYPDKILGEDEQVVERLHPHWITLVPATLWFLAVCVAAGFGIGYAPEQGTARAAVVIGILAVGAVLLVLLAVVPLIRWRATHYVFTTHRVLIRRGVLRHAGRDIPLQRINDVGFEQSLWDRIVNAGTLTIESAGERGQETLVDIPDSERQQQRLNRLIEEDGARRARAAYGGGQPWQPPPYPPR